MTIRGGAPWTEPGATFQSTDTRKHISINKIFDYPDGTGSHDKGLYFSTCKNSDALQLRRGYFQGNDPYKFDLYFGRNDHSVTFGTNSFKQNPVALYGDASLAQYADSNGFLSPSQVPDSQVNGGTGIGHYGTIQYVDTTTATRFRGFVYSYDPDNDGHFGITFNVSGMDFYFVLDGQVLSPTGTVGARRWYNVFLTPGLHPIAWYMLPNGPDALYELVDFNYHSDAYPHIVHVSNPAMWFGAYVAGMEYRPDLVYYKSLLPNYHDPLFVTTHPLQSVMNSPSMTFYDFGVRDTAGAMRAGNWNNVETYDMAATQEYFTRTYNKSLPLKDSYGNATGATLSALSAWDVHGRGHAYKGTIDDNQLFFSKASNNPTLRIESLPAEYTSGGYEVRLYINASWASHTAYTVTDNNGYSSTLYLYQSGWNTGWPLADTSGDPLGGPSGYRGSVDTGPTGTETANYLLFQGLSGSQVDITPVAGYSGQSFAGMQISSNPTADASAITVPAFASLPRASNGNLVRYSEMMEAPGTYTITYSGYEDTEPTLRTVVVTDL